MYCRNRFCGFTFALLMGVAAINAAATAQDSKIQQLPGAYLGLASFGVGTTPFRVQLAIDQQDNRTFLGTALLPYIEQDNLAVKGTIAASGACTIQADSEDGRSTLKLDWLAVDGGAAGLTGEASAQVDYGDGSIRAAGPVALLRPFAKLDVDWGDGIAQAEFRSQHIGQVLAGVPIDFLGGPTGLFAARFTLGREGFEILGSSSTDQQVFAVGVSGSLVITIAGQVKINERAGVIGEYLIQTAGGKTADFGILFIEQA